MTTGPEEALELAQVVILSRHGIRAPYLPDDNLTLLDFTKDTEGPVYQSLSKSLKEQFGVPASALTKAGGVNVLHMGRYFREYYIQDRGFPIDNKTACESALNTDTIFFYSDDSQRDIETAGNFSLTFLPDCPPKIYVERDYVLPLFNQGADSSLCPVATWEQIAGMVGAEDKETLNENVIEANKLVIKEINSILNCCEPIVCHNKTNHCNINHQPRAFTPHFWEVFVGPINLAGYWAEYFELQYINNNSDVMFGRLAPTVPIQEKLAQFGGLRMTTYDVPTNYWAAQNFGSDLMVNIMATMESVVTGTKIEGLKTGPRSKFVYYAGHDFNLLFIRRFLNINWYSHGWSRSQTVLGGMLVFELYRGNLTKQYYVKTVYVAASMDQLRNQVPLTDKEGGEAPWRAAISVPGCDKLACPWQQFKQLVMKRVKPECMHEASLKDWAQRAVSDNDHGRDQFTKQVVLITLGGLGILLAALVVVVVTIKIVYRIKSQPHQSYEQGDCQTQVVSSVDLEHQTLITDRNI